MFGPCFVMQYLVSFLFFSVISQRERERERERERGSERADSFTVKPV